MLDGEHGRGRCVAEVHIGGDAGAVPHDREAAPAHEPELGVLARSVQTAAPKDDPTGVEHELLERANRVERLVHLGQRARVERILLGLDRAAGPLVGPAREALRDEALDAVSARGSKERFRAGRAQDVRGGEALVEVLRSVNPDSAVASWTMASGR